MLRGYRAIVNARFRVLLQYRAAAFAGFATQFFWGLMRVMIFEAFYRSSSAHQPMNLPDVISYVWLGQAMLVMLPWNVDPDIRALIRSGSVAYELLRPLDLYWFWYVRAVAWRTAPVVLRALPMFVIAGLFFGLKPPASPASAGAWVLATFGALLLGCAITTLMTICLMWTISGEGINRLIFVGVMVCSGMLVPLPLYPNWAQAALDFLPFRGLVDTPFRLYVGHIPPSGVVGVFAQQLVWTAVLVIASRALLSVGVRRLVVQGG